MHVTKINEFHHGRFSGNFMKILEGSLFKARAKIYISVVYKNLQERFIRKNIQILLTLLSCFCCRRLRGICSIGLCNYKEARATWKVKQTSIMKKVQNNTTLHKKRRFLRISSVNVSKFAVSYVFGCLLQKSVVENLIYCAVLIIAYTNPVGIH